MIKPLDAKKIVSLLLLFAYTWIVSILQMIRSETEITWLLVLFWGLFSAGLTLFVYMLFDKFGLTELTLSAPAASRKREAILIIAVFAITFFFFIMYLGANYPGGMSPDEISQYRQASTGIYSNWHPYLHTLLFYLLPIRTGHGLGLIVALQLFYFSLAFTYLIYVLYRNGCPKIPLCMICVFVWVNPYLATYFMFPYKDVAMTIFAILLVGFYIQIIGSKGDWLRKIPHVILFAAVAVACVYMRHNAILFVAPLVAILFFYGAKTKKIKLYMVLFIVAFVALIEGGSVGLNVESPGQRTVETIGFPLTVWCNVMKYKPEALPEDTREVMYEIATEEDYENYETGNFNSIKYSETLDKDLIDTLSYGEVLKYTWQCFRHAPGPSVRAATKLSSLVWSVDGSNPLKKVSIRENAWGIEKAPRRFGGRILNTVKSLANTPMGKTLFGSYGLEIWTMLAVGFILLAKGRISILHFLPLFCYDFGTMLLLSGPDYRFFLLNIPLWGATLFLMFKDETMLKRSSSPRANSHTDTAPTA